MRNHFLRAVPKATSGVGVSLAGTAGSVSNLTTYTLSSSFGAEDTTREIFVVVSWASTTTSRTISSATIGGISATISSQYSSLTSGIACIRAAVPTGTTGNIVVTMTGGCQRMSTTAYRIVNRSNPNTSHTDVDQFASTSYSSPLTTNLVTINSGGFVIGGMSVASDISGSLASSTFNYDSWNTTVSSETSWQAGFSYINTTGSSQTPTQSLTWSGGAISARWSYWAFNG